MKIKFYKYVLLIILSEFFYLTKFDYKAWSAPPEGVDLNSYIHQWFSQQYNINGQNCCGISDGHIIDEDDWRVDKFNTGYEVRIFGEWASVPAKSWRDTNPEQANLSKPPFRAEPYRGAPNPTGKPIVWYSVIWELKGELQIPHLRQIFCFAPGNKR